MPFNHRVILTAVGVGVGRKTEQEVPRRAELESLGQLDEESLS